MLTAVVLPGVLLSFALLPAACAERHMEQVP